MRVYLDHNAGSPMRPAAGAAMMSWLEGHHGNPASVHHAGQKARRALEFSRQQVADLMGCPTARSIHFTSGGTESNNLAIFGATRAAGGLRRRIISSTIEHSSVLAPLAELEGLGFDVVRIETDREGRIDPEAVVDTIDESVALVTLGLVNAEVGTIQEVGSIAESSRSANAIFHLDAAQAAGRIPLRVDELGCDLMTISAHKLGGPAGIGALYVRSGTPIAPTILGGPQESGLRAGTPNLPGAIGFGAAAEESLRLIEEERRRIERLAETLLDRLAAAIPGLRLNGPRNARIANTLNLAFPGVLGESMLIALDLEGIEVSMGSACAAGAVEPSHVLAAMGRDQREARSSLRLSLGWSTTAAEIAYASEVIPRIWHRVAQVESVRAAEAPR